MLSIFVLALLGAGVVLEAFAELARMRRLARDERDSWLEASPSETAPGEQPRRAA
jgi:hypothetical protein